MRDVRNEGRLCVNGVGCERRADEKVRSGVDRELVRVRAWSLDGWERIAVRSAEGTTLHWKQSMSKSHEN